MRKINFNKIHIFLFLFPFLFGRGFFETKPIIYSAFKYLMLCVLLIELIWVLTHFLRKNIKIPHLVFCVIGYYVLFTMITVFKQSGINEGIQKLFYAPIFFFVSFYYLKFHFRDFVQVASSIMIVMFTLNITIFNTFFYDGFDSYFHITFLGHVQLISQACVLAILLSFILLKIFNNKKKSLVLFILTIFNLLYSGTTASYIVLTLVLLMLVLKKIKIGNSLNVRFVLCTFLILNLCLFSYALFGESIYSENSLLTLSGRTEIRSKGLKLFTNEWLLGYGAYGVKIVPFWEVGKEGFNYAHNDLLQLLLDGGIVLTTYFFMIIYKQLKEVNLIKDIKIKSEIYSIVLLFFVIMLVESCTEYYYYFILFFNIVYVSRSSINKIGEKM